MNAIILVNACNGRASPFRRTFELGEFITAAGKSIIDLVAL
jgi:hypothetical protein